MRDGNLLGFRPGMWWLRIDGSKRHNDANQSDDLTPSTSPIMSWRLRPRFGLRLRLSSDEVMERFGRTAESETSPCEVFLFDRQVEMTVPATRRHFWSPYLKVLVRREHGETVLRGKFGPNISVWSMFLAAYAVAGLTGAAGLFIGISQWQIGLTPTGFWLSGGCLLLAVLVWIAGKVGQRWAYGQMVAIHLFVHELFADAIADDVYCEACVGDEVVESWGRSVVVS